MHQLPANAVFAMQNDWAKASNQYCSSDATMLLCSSQMRISRPSSAFFVSQLTDGCLDELPFAHVPSKQVHKLEDGQNCRQPECPALQGVV
jgi:hypothetical protein